MLETRTARACKISSYDLFRIDYSIFFSKWGLQLYAAVRREWSHSSTQSTYFEGGRYRYQSSPVTGCFRFHAQWLPAEKLLGSHQCNVGTNSRDVGGRHDNVWRGTWKNWTNEKRIPSHGFSRIFSSLSRRSWGKTAGSYQFFNIICGRETWISSWKDSGSWRLGRWISGTRPELLPECG